ncbi:MAG TPA: RsmE family RNA methyltransferase, partial [Coriobacteriia bacterium]|nr:RsmE family RNA methyltransferase [Coriobacteriia bacterium]
MRPRFFVAPEGVEHGDALVGALAASTPRNPDEPSLVGVLVELAPSDARHARTVLRVRPGEPCDVVFSGTRVLAEAVFEEVGDRVTVRVTDRATSGPASRVELLLVQGLPQPRKVDEVVEKGTEVGVDAFLITLAAGSPRVPLGRLDARAARWRSVAAEAAKQSKQLAIPEIRTAVSVEAALDSARSEGWQSVVLTPSATQHLGSVLRGG